MSILRRQRRTFQGVPIVIRCSSLFNARLSVCKQHQLSPE